MGHGKAIFDYADEEEQQPLLAQYHEDGQLFLTFFDLRIRKPITIATHEGAKSFLRQAADLIDPDTGELERIRFLERELDRYKVAHEDFCRPLMAWADLNGHLPETLGASRGSAACTHLHHLIKMSLEAALNTQERSLFTELMYQAQRTELQEAQTLLADLHQVLKGLPSQPITDTLRRYVEDRRLLATDEIPF